MFEHVTILLSFVFAIALTHLLSSSTELVIARKRLRFSGLYAVWALNALLMLMANWLAVWGLVALKHWTVAEVAIQFISAITQYFTCSAFRVSEPQGEDIDLPAIFDERRPLIASAFIALGFIAIFQNWWDRSNMAGMGPNDWIGEDVAVVPMIIAVAIAGWARRSWLQWAAAIIQLGLTVALLTIYAMPGA